MMKFHRFLSIITMLVMVLSFTLVPSVPMQGAVASPAESPSGPPDALGDNDPDCDPGILGQLGPDCHDVDGLKVTKTADDEFISPGDPMGFTITVTNVGKRYPNNVRLDDELPEGITWSVDHPDCSIKPGGWMHCKFGKLSVGESVSVHLSAMSTGEMCGVVKNQAMAYTRKAFIAYSNIAKITIVCSTNIAVTKEAEVSSISPGETARFMMTVRNTGTQIAQDVTLTDTLPVMEGLTWAIDSVSDDGICTIANGVLNCTFGDLDPDVNRTRTVVISAVVPAGRCNEQIVNHVTVRAENEEPASLKNNTDSATIYLNCASLELYKVADAASVAPGAPIGFVIRVKNTGQAVATNVQVLDQLEPLMVWNENSEFCSIDANKLMTCNFGNLATGQEASVHVTSVSSPDVCGTLENTATATAENFTQKVIATADIFIDCGPDLTVSKRAGASFVYPGQMARYFITVTNAGTGTVFEAVLNDPLPAADTLDWKVENPEGDGKNCEINNQGTLVCNLGRMNPGATRTITISAPVTQVDCGQQLINTATVSGSNGQQEPSENNVSSETISLACPSFQLVKTADDNLVSLGKPVGFTITLINESGQTATAVQVRDLLDSRTTWSESSSFCTIANHELNCNFGDIPSEQSVDVQVSGISTAEMCGTVTNTAEAWADNISALTSSASVTVDCEPNVAVTKTAVDPSVSIGQSAQFNMTVINSGSADAQNVVLTDSLPHADRMDWAVGNTPDAGSCEITGGKLECKFGTLQPGDTRIISVTAPVTTNNCGTVINNTASVSVNNEPEINSGDNSSSAAISTVCTTLQVSKVADEGVVGLNQPVGFTITVTNRGDVPAASVVLRDVVGTDTTWTADNDACAFDQGVMTCNFGELAAQSSAEVHISGTATAAMCGLLTNTATASMTGITEPVSGVASVTVDCAVEGVDVEVVKTAETGALFLGEATPLATARFNITVSNVGQATAQNVTLTDPLLDPISGDVTRPNPGNLPELLTWAIDPSGDGASCNITNRVLSCSFGSLARGAERTVSISAQAEFAVFSAAIVNQDLPMPQVFKNEATVAATGDTLVANNKSAAEIQVFTSGQELVCYSPRLLYENNFNTDNKGAATWSSNFHYTTSPGTTGHQPEKFLGEYGTTDQVTFGLNLPSETEVSNHNFLRIRFDLYILRSWDGSSFTMGPDRWRTLLLDGTGHIKQVLMDNTFSNFDDSEELRKTSIQSYPGMYPYFKNEARTGAKAINTLGYTFRGLYRDTTFGITHYIERPSSQTLTLGFSSLLNHGIDDESWGIDNLMVEMCILNPQYSLKQKLYIPILNHVPTTQ